MKTINELEIEKLTTMLKEIQLYPNLKKFKKLKFTTKQRCKLTNKELLPFLPLYFLNFNKAWEGVNDSLKNFYLVNTL